MSLQYTVSVNPPRTLNISLWVVQALLAVFFGWVGFFKATAPIDVLAQTLVWPGEMSPLLVRFVGVSELAAAFGLVQPAASGIFPRLTSLAAAGLVVVMILAGGFHIMRGEYFVLPMNAVLGSLAAFVAWGRR